jgi:hypothetical protein
MADDELNSERIKFGQSWGWKVTARTCTIFRPG